MPTPKAARTAISAVGSTTPVSTTALETTTCQRRGTAAMVTVIIREPYSRAPRTPTRSTALQSQSMTRPSRPRRWRGLVATLVAIGAVGCSDDPTAEERVCDARTELREAADDVVTDVQAANFGEASDGTAAVSEAYNELVVALDDLGQEQREALAPLVEGLAADIEALPDAQGLDELGSSLDAILSEVQQIYDETTEALQCE